MGDLARILVYGDLHLSSKNYGSHNNYPKESLDILRLITDKASEIQATHIVGLGDFAFGRFHTLEYRTAVEAELEKQYQICSGNRYELKGNHDSAGYGMTEYEYYIGKGLLKPSTNLAFGDVRITMADYGALHKIQPNFEQNCTNFLFAHDFLSFKGLPIPNYGKCVEMDNMTGLFGLDIAVCGHIHTSGQYRGVMVGKSPDGTNISRDVMLDYLGAMTRPAYLGDATDKVGHMLVIKVKDDGYVDYDRLDINLPPIEEIFNLAEIAAKHAKAEAREEDKRDRLDVSDIVHSLDEHERAIMNPEDFILSLPGVDERVKTKAIELLKMSGA